WTSDLIIDPRPARTPTIGNREFTSCPAALATIEPETDEVRHHTFSIGGPNGVPHSSDREVTGDHSQHSHHGRPPEIPSGRERETLRQHRAGAGGRQRPRGSRRRRGPDRRPEPRPEER